MAINNLADIIINHVDLSIINNAIKQRAEALGSQMNEEAASQFVSDMSQFEASVESSGSSLVFKSKLSDSYLLNYLKNHGTPVAGGDNGEAHNVDGSTYESRVPKALQGTPIPWYELPHLDGEEEVQHLVEIMAPDAAEDAANNSADEIKEQIAVPLAREYLSGGG